MPRAPYLLDRARSGYRMGNAELIDSMIRDGLWDIYKNVHMGICGDRCAEKFGFTREQQDEFAINSFKRALEASQKGTFKREIEPVPVKAGKEMILVAEDENPKKFNEEKLRKLRPAFGEFGTVTAGNASIHGGAVALGHPIGASGARTLVTLINALRERGGRLGINSLCVGGGMGVAMAIELCQ
jgi:acetyl-CoA C-acetyltransferase